jgi:hypothetical protein
MMAALRRRTLNVFRSPAVTCATIAATHVQPAIFYVK